MNRSAANYSFRFIEGSGKLFLASVFFFMIGISAGVFTELMMSAAEKESAISYFSRYFVLPNMTGAEHGDLFLSSCAGNLGLLIIIIASSITAIGFPVAIAALAYKGVVLGFSASLLIDRLSFKGISFIFTSMAPQNIILIPAFIAATAIGLRLAFDTLSNRKYGLKKSLSENCGPFVFFNVIFVVTILIGCAIEAFICPFLTLLTG